MWVTCCSLAANCRRSFARSTSAWSQSFCCVPSGSIGSLLVSIEHQKASPSILISSGQPTSPPAQTTLEPAVAFQVLLHQMWSEVVFFQSGWPLVGPPPKPYGNSSNDHESERKEKSTFSSQRAANTH